MAATPPIPEIGVSCDGVLAAVADAVLLVGADGRIGYANPAAERLFAEAGAPLAGRRATDVLPVEVASGAEDGAGGGAGRAALAEEWREAHCRRSGRRFEVRSVAAGAARVLTVRDVTGRREREREREVAPHAGEPFFRRIVESAEEGFWLLDPAGRTAYVNDRMARMLGYTPGQMAGRHLFEFLDERERAEAAASLAGRREGTREQHEVAFVRADGSRVWTLVCAGPMYDDGGRYVGALAGVIDISARKAVEERLRASEERYRLLADHIPQITWMGDLDGNLVDMNARFPAYTGLSRQELLGRGWRRVILPEEEEGIDQVVRRWREMEDPYEFEVRLRRADGAYRWHLQKALPIRDERGRTVRWFGTVTDIEELKRAELALRQARDQAEEAVAVRNRFLAVVSHELRTPLASILLWAKLLKGGALGAGQRAKGLETIIQAATEQSRLVGELVDVARGASGRLVGERRRVDVAAVVRSAAERVSPDFNAKGVALEASASAAEVLGDGARLRQLVSNLLANALEFTPAGGRVRVTGAEADGRVVMEVADTGEGLPAEALPRAFDLFWQADGSRARAQQGLGLGLYIVRQIAEAHGGTASVRSDGPGRGCTFRIELPAAAGIAGAEGAGADGGAGAEGAGAEAAPDRDPDPDAHPDPARLGGVRVLVVDDDAALLESMGALLSAWGAEVRRAGGGEDALRELERQRSDVVVADLAMPGMDGRALARTIRSAPGLERLPLIAVSALPGAEARDGALGVGFDRFLAKPFTPDALVGEIVSLLGRRPG